MKRVRGKAVSYVSNMIRIFMGAKAESCSLYKDKRIEL